MDKSITAGDFEICVQWFQSDVESVSVEEAEVTRAQPKALFLLYALNNKALNLASSPGSAQVKAGLCRVIDTRVQALHEKLKATLETAENDLIPVQTSQAAVGTTEQNKSEFVDLKRLKMWER